MFDLILDPPVTGKTPEPFLQSIRLMEGDKVIGEARWISGAEGSEGIVQILELSVIPEQRRKGNARRLMDVLTSQALDHFKSRKNKLRRMWLVLAQKRHVIARSFLMKYTFHHVGTIGKLLRDEDMLVYMRTFD